MYIASGTSFCFEDNRRVGDGRLGVFFFSFSLPLDGVGVVFDDTVGSGSVDGVLAPDDMNQHLHLVHYFIGNENIKYWLDGQEG
jgi:hypothetical protein